MKNITVLLLITVFALAGCIPKKGQLKTLATQDGAYRIESYSFDEEAQTVTILVRSRNMLATGEIKPFGKRFRYDGENWIAVAPSMIHTTNKSTLSPEGAPSDER